MESKSLFYILIVIILILNLISNREKFLNLIKKNERFSKLIKKNENFSKLIKKNERFLNLVKKNEPKCCNKNCQGKPNFLKDKNCEKNKNVNKNTLKNQLNSKFTSLQEFYDKRPKFELEPTGNNEPLVEKEERDNNLKESINKKEYLPAFVSNKSIINYGKPGFYIK